MLNKFLRMVLMEIYIGFFASILTIVLGVLMNVFIGYLLLVCWLIFAFIGIKKGYSIRDLYRMSYKGGKKSILLVQILFLIGAVSGAWMASGTIPGIVYYSLRFIKPDDFILLSFLICCGASFLLGSATGTVSIVGLPLIILAKSGDVNLNLAAGAIIAGVYFGDRCSPMSSSAILVSNLTDTNLFKNIKNMLYSSFLPFLLSIAFYYEFSKLSPLDLTNNSLTGEIYKSFNVGMVVFIPILIILILSLLRVDIKYAMLFSMISASIVAVFVQGLHPVKVLEDIVFGLKLGQFDPLRNILEGGGIESMSKACMAIFTACCLAGILEGINAFEGIKNYLMRLRLSGLLLYVLTTVISTMTAAFGCTQSIAVVMTDEIMKGCYHKEGKYKFALDIENSCILTSALIPWNIAAMICTATLSVSMYGFIPYAFYLYIFPISNLLQIVFKDGAKRRLIRLKT